MCGETPLIASLKHQRNQFAKKLIVEFSASMKASLHLKETPLHIVRVLFLKICFSQVFFFLFPFCLIFFHLYYFLCFSVSVFLLLFNLCFLFLCCPLVFVFFSAILYFSFLFGFSLSLFERLSGTTISILLLF